MPTHQSQLSWWWRWGSATFLEELVGAVNRINYNQRNEQLNALAGARPCSSREDCVWGGGWRVGASVGVVRCFVIESLREETSYHRSLSLVLRYSYCFCMTDTSNVMIGPPRLPLEPSLARCACRDCT